MKIHVVLALALIATIALSGCINQQNVKATASPKSTPCPTITCPKCNCPSPTITVLTEKPAGEGKQIIPMTTFSVKNFSALSNGTLTIELKNNLDHVVELTGITSEKDNWVGSVKFEANESHIISFKELTTKGKAVGTPVELHITIYYVDLQNAMGSKDRWILKGKIE